MLINDFDYTLPEELIAQAPLTKRDSSKLMSINRSTGDRTHLQFHDILDALNENDLLVLNDTRVINARLFGHKTTGARVEIFLLSAIDNHTWKTLVKPAKRVKVGDSIIIADDVSLTVTSKEDGFVTLSFNSKVPVFDILERYGEVPIPPYIKDAKKQAHQFKKTYQTVFASSPGAVAAPTAGLHFTDELIDKIKKKGVTIVPITLHVGYGTFKPISTENIVDHTMHAESYYISESSAKTLTEALGKKRIIAVGTTSIRTLETAYSNGMIPSGWGSSSLYIYPGYTFNVINGMITNFHLPKSSLMLLVSAFIGKDQLLEAYQDAIKHRYRFYSFGDAMFIT